jgi:ubiquinone/menaquinone biosynthesis C-methylase UbiE
MNKTQRTYLPAAGLDLFLPFYDLIAKLVGADRARQALFDVVPLRPGSRVLDIGCGTGTFMFHHLEGSNREKTLREVRRVLKPGGSFYLLAVVSG